MVCPKCGSQNVQALVEQEIKGKVIDKRKTKGFGWCKGCLMTCIIGPFGWLCGLCGMGKTKGKYKDNRTYNNKIVYCCLDCGNRFQ